MNKTHCNNYLPVKLFEKKIHCVIHCSLQGHYNNQICDREVVERGELETDNSTRAGNQAAVDGGICGGLRSMLPPKTVCMPVVCGPTGGRAGVRVVLLLKVMWMPVVCAVA